MSDTIKEVEIGEDELKAIAKHVPTAEVDYDKVAKMLDEIQAKAAKKQEKENNKLKGDEAVEGEVVDKFGKMSKEAFVVAQLNAALSGNHKELGELNAHSVKTLREKGLVEKATYLNAGTDADGAVLVPNADLLNDIFDVLPRFSGVANELRTITLTTGDSIDISSITADVVMTEVGTEGGAKTVTKPTIGDTNVAVREWAGIALMTKKLLRQSAMDVYGIVRDSFARAIAKKREELALTDATSGIVNKAGVAEVFAGGSSTSGSTSVADISYADIMGLPFEVPTQSAAGGVYVISRLLVKELSKKVDTNGQPIMVLDNASAGALTGTFANGYRFIVAETLGTADAVTSPFAVFGNFSQYGVLVRQGAVDSQVFDSGTVTDGGATDHNLIQENKLALRTEIWEAVGFPIASAFAVLKTSTT